MSTTYEYPASFIEDAAGRMVVSFPDMPEALTDGADMNEAITEAKDCLLEAIQGRIADDEKIPNPSAPQNNQVIISVNFP